MKLTASIALASLTLLSFVAGCKKDDNTTTTPVAPTVYMTAKIGDSTFTAHGDTLASMSTSSSGGITITYLRGNSFAGQTIVMSIIGNIATGTKSIGTGEASAQFYSTGTSGSYTYATTGTITVTETAPKVKGTFSFNCADSTAVTNGTFSVTAL